MQALNAESLSVFNVTQILNPKFSTDKQPFYEIMTYPLLITISKSNAKFVYNLHYEQVRNH